MLPRDLSLSLLHLYIYMYLNIYIYVRILLRSYEFKILSLSNQDFLIHLTCGLAVATAQISLVDLAEWDNPKKEILQVSVSSSVYKFALF